MSMDADRIILAGRNFTSMTPEKPHVDRNDGGHIIIVSNKSEYTDLAALSVSLSEELMRHTLLVGKAMLTALRNNGVALGNINYQINGNWSMEQETRDPLHFHLYGRARGAKYQTFGEALHFPAQNSDFYDDFDGLSEKDIKDIRDYVNRNSTFYDVC